MKDTYKTIEKPSEGYYKDKGSKFLAYAYPVSNEQEIKKIIADLKKKHHSARHHCYAWQLGTEEKSYKINDDGEPSSTAGKPILGQLQSFEVTNILLVVVRYFGGKLLGVNGLINAYRSAAYDALENAQVKIKIIEERFLLKFTYNEMNDVMLTIKQENLEIINTKFEEQCDLILRTKKSDAKRISETFKNIYGVNVTKLD